VFVRAFHHDMVVPPEELIAGSSVAQVDRSSTRAWFQADGRERSASGLHFADAGNLAALHRQLDPPDCARASDEREP
jgi:hypothetical protein